VGFFVLMLTAIALHKAYLEYEFSSVEKSPFWKPNRHFCDAAVMQ